MLQQDRSQRRDNEPTGEAESLWGKIDPKAFGDRAQRTINDVKERREKKRKLDQERARHAVDKAGLKKQREYIKLI